MNDGRETALPYPLYDSGTARIDITLISAERSKNQDAYSFLANILIKQDTAKLLAASLFSALLFVPMAKRDILVDC